MTRLLTIVLMSIVVTQLFGAPAPKPRPLPPKKLDRVPDPSPELQAQLQQLDETYRHGTPKQFAEMEEKAKALAKQHPAKDDQARVLGQLAWVAAQSGVDKHAEIARKYATKCLEISRDPLERGRMVSVLASTVNFSGSAFAQGRRDAAVILVDGYREILAQELPETAPELPGVGKFDIEGGAEEALARARHATQMAAREEAKFIRAQIELRDMLVLQLRDLYKPDTNRHGHSADGPEELQALAAERLTDKQVRLLMKKVKE